MIHPKAEFLFICEPMKSDKLLASKIQWWDSQRIDIFIPKGSTRKEERGEWSQASSKYSMCG